MTKALHTHVQDFDDCRRVFEKIDSILMSDDILDRHFTKLEHIDVSAGSIDAGKPIILDSAGRIPQSMRHLWSVLIKTSDYSMSVNDEVILADATSGALTITLPPVSAANRLTYHIKRINTNANAVTVAGVL